MLAAVGFFGSTRVPSGVKRPRLPVEPIGYWTREEYGDDQTDEHFDSEENEAEEECGIFPGRKSPKQGDVRHDLAVVRAPESECGGEEGRKG